MIHHEPLTAKAGRGPGRPPSGKKAYCIRMNPKTRDQLLKAAQDAGFNSLGDWFDDIVSAPSDGRDQVADKHR